MTAANIAGAWSGASLYLYNLANVIFLVTLNQQHLQTAYFFVNQSTKLQNNLYYYKQPLHHVERFRWLFQTLLQVPSWIL